MTTAGPYHRRVPEQLRLVSYARDHEDVVLWRALRGVTGGRYVDLGTGHPAGHLTRALHEQGWHGVAVTADEARQDVLRDQRPATPVLTAAADVPDGPCHVLAAEHTDPAAVTELVGRTQPWVVVVAGDAVAAVPALRDAGYDVALDIGPSAILVAGAHGDLTAQLRHPANSLDDYVDAAAVTQQADLDTLTEELQRWRGLAVSEWATWQPRYSSEWTVHDQRERDSLRAQLEAIQQTLSWRITRPLRALRGITSR